MFGGLNDRIFLFTPQYTQYIKSRNEENNRIKPVYFSKNQL